MATVLEELQVVKTELSQEIKYVLNCFRRGNQKHHILMISAFPKSGSTYFWKAIEAITGLPSRFPTPDMPHANRTELDQIKLRRARLESFICRLHMLATPRNIQLMKKHSLRPVVLVRNIADVIISLDDHLHKENSGTPSGHEPVWYKNMSRDERFEFLIKVHAPWYLNFVMSWNEAEKSLPVFWLTYENLFRDRIEMLKNVLDFWGIAKDKECIERKVGKLADKNTRRNVGVEGRGQLLSMDNRKVLESLVKCCNLPERLRFRIGLN